VEDRAKVEIEVTALVPDSAPDESTAQHA